jgi:WD40 repeat protein
METKIYGPAGQANPASNPCPLQNISALALSPDGKRIASGSDNSGYAYYSVEFKVWDAEKGTELFSHYTPIDYSVFVNGNSNGKHIYTRATLSMIYLWDTSTGKKLNSITGGSNEIRYADMSPDGTYIAGALSDTDIIKIWDTETGREINTISNPPAMPGRL